MLFINPPFGNYLNLHNAISIKGSFTLHPRTGLFMQIIKTLRYDFKHKGWTNKIGLRNPGIEYAIQKYYVPISEDDSKNYSMNSVISIAIIDKDEIEPLNDIVPDDCNIELNVSCPNVDKDINYKQCVYEELGVFYNDSRKWCIVKLSPKDIISDVDILYKQGFRQFNCCNTYPISKEQGGLSGPFLAKHSLKLIKQIKDKYPDSEIIGGGGIKNNEDVKKYIFAGANHVAVSTLCFSPLLFYQFYNMHIHTYHLIK
jgi:dihydroorotate dehydrogenase